MSDRKVFNVHGLYPSDYCFDWEAFEADPEHYAFTADDIAYFNAMELERFEKETPMTPYEKRAVRRWVLSGHSVMDAPPSKYPYIHSHYPPPCFLDVYRTDKELDAYIPYGGRNLYFNADGIVVENSPLTVKGVTYVTGITLNSAEIGMPLSSENSAGLFLVLDALQILRKYEIKAERIVLTQKGSITMFMDDIIVILGRSDFELKIAKIAQLRPYLEGRKGTIDLTTYSSSDQNIILK